MRYVPYHKDEKSKIQRFINGFPLSFEDWIEFDEPFSLEETITKLRNCYEQSKHKPKCKCEWKGNENTIVKWTKKSRRSQGASEKE